MFEEFFKADCPDHLTDETLMIETAGEMPEVALAESLHHLEPLPDRDLACLRSAVARAYLAMIRRDLDYRSLGRASYRGLERALANLGRLGIYLARLGWGWPPGLKKSLRHELAAYLDAEAEALAKGRPYASASCGHLRALASELRMNLDARQALLDQMQSLPWLDFLGLRALKGLETEGGYAKRRRKKGGLMVMEVLDERGRSLSRAALPLINAAGDPDPEYRARVELVWSLLRLPAAAGD